MSSQAVERLREAVSHVTKDKKPIREGHTL